MEPLQVRPAGRQDTAAVKGLWAYCFERPGDPFFDWYFEKVYRPEEVLVGEAGGRIACDLHLRPYTVSLRGQAREADYIVGVATHPAARGRGYAGRLLAEAFRASQKAGKWVDILMPSDGSFYRPLGFTYYAHQWEREAPPRYLAEIGEKAERASTIEGSAGWSLLDKIYQAYTAERHGYTLRREADWERLIAGQLAEGYIAVVYDDKGPAGYLFYSIGERKLTVSEMAFSSERGRRGLYAYMAGHMGSVDQCWWQEPEDDRSYYDWPGGAEHRYIKNETFPYMMARLTDPVRAFDGCAAPAGLAGEAVIRIEDPLLPENTGNYRLSASRGNDGAPVIRAAPAEEAPQFSMGIGAAAELLFGAKAMSGLLRSGHARKEREAPESLRFLEEAFPREKNWINEWY